MVIHLNKPKYLLPFIYVYKMVNFLFVFIIKLLKYINVGFFITLLVLIDIVVSTVYYFVKLISYGLIYFAYFEYKFLKFIFIGFVVISRWLYRFIRYVILGATFPFIIIFNALIKLNEINEKMYAKQQMEQERKKLAKENNRKINE